MHFFIVYNNGTVYVMYENIVLGEEEWHYHFTT